MSENKYKINIDRPQPTKEEIEAYKNFDELLGSVQNIKIPIYKKPYFWIGSGLIAACTIVAMLYFGGLLWNTNPSLANQPFINPPIPSIQVQYIDYKISADSGGVINVASGSKIIIPANAFADENGNILKGTVSVKYREFHDMADCFISGIPMGYDSAGKHFDFQTAGMFDIGASQENKKVFLASGKTVEVKMNSAEKENKFNFYKLDTVNKKWTYLGKDTGRVVPIQMVDPLAKDSIIYSNTWDTAKSKNKVGRTETNVLAKVELLPTERSLGINIKPNFMEIDSNTPSRSKLPEKPIIPKKADAHVQTFTLDIIPEQFPELTTYHGVVFEVGKENKNFDRKTFDVEWDDMKLTKGKSLGSYNLTLFASTNKFPSGKYELIVYPAFKGGDYDKAMKIYDKKFKTYQSTIKAQEMEITRQKKEELVRQKKLEMQNAEFEKRNAALLKKQKMQHENQISELSYGETRRVFAINSFGIYNSDYPYHFSSPVSIKVKTIDKKRNSLYFQQVYLVDKTRKFMHTFYSLGMGGNFQFEPGDQNILFGFLPGNRLAVFKEDKFSKLEDKNNGEVDLVMEIEDKTFKNVEQVRDYIIGNTKTNNLP